MLGSVIGTTLGTAATTVLTTALPAFLTNLVTGSVIGAVNGHLDVGQILLNATAAGLTAGLVSGVNTLAFGADAPTLASTLAPGGGGLITGGPKGALGGAAGGALGEELALDVPTNPDGTAQPWAAGLSQILGGLGSALARDPSMAGADAALAGFAFNYLSHSQLAALIAGDLRRYLDAQKTSDLILTMILLPGQGRLSGLGKEADELALRALGTGSNVLDLTVETPYGVATQSDNIVALRARTSVEQGATLYRIGTMGTSQAAEAQFWSLESPLSPDFAARYGIPAENVAIETATVKPGTTFITRSAPPVGNNPGAVSRLLCRQAEFK
jgi:hypothetical protein